MKKALNITWASMWKILHLAWWFVFLLACFIYFPIIIDYTNKAISNPTMSASAIWLINLLPSWVLLSVVGLAVYKIYRIIRVIDETKAKKEAKHE